MAVEPCELLRVRLEPPHSQAMINPHEHRLEVRDDVVNGPQGGEIVRGVEPLGVKTGQRRELRPNLGRDKS